MSNIAVIRKLKKSEVNKAKNHFAQTVKTKRLAAELTQETLADIINVDRKTINRIENGHFSPNLETLLRICAALDINIQKVFKNI